MNTYLLKKLFFVICWRWLLQVTNTFVVQKYILNFLCLTSWNTQAYFCCKSLLVYAFFILSTWHDEGWVYMRTRHYFFYYLLNYSIGNVIFILQQTWFCFWIAPIFYFQNWIIKYVGKKWANRSVQNEFTEVGIFLKIHLSVHLLD